MAIPINEFKDLVNSIIENHTDAAQLTALTVKVYDAYQEALKEGGEAAEKVAVLEADNESLRSANMDFFKRITEQDKEQYRKNLEEGGQEQTPEERADTITTADLFTKKE